MQRSVVNLLLLGAAYILWLYQRTLLGETKPTGLLDLSLRELITMTPFVIGIFVAWAPTRPATRLVRPTGQRDSRVPLICTRPSPLLGGNDTCGFNHRPGNFVE